MSSIRTLNRNLSVHKGLQPPKAIEGIARNIATKKKRLFQSYLVAGVCSTRMKGLVSMDLIQQLLSK